MKNLQHYRDQLNNFTSPLFDRINSLKAVECPAVVSDHLAAERKLQQAAEIISETSDTLSEFDIKQNLIKCQNLANSALELIAREEEAREDLRKRVEEFNSLSEEEQEQRRKSAQAIAALDDIDHPELPELTTEQLNKIDAAKREFESKQRAHENEEHVDWNAPVPTIDQPSALEDIDLDWQFEGYLRTSRGPRQLHEAPATPAFWELWNSKKTALKNAGITYTKDPESGWLVQWWKEVSEETIAEVETEKAKTKAWYDEQNQKYLEENPEVAVKIESEKAAAAEKKDAQKSLERLVASLEWTRTSIGSSLYKLTDEMLKNREALETAGFYINDQEAQWGRENYIKIAPKWIDHGKGPQYRGF